MDADVGDAQGGSGFRASHAMVLAPFVLVGVLASRTIIDNGFLWHIRAGAVQAGLQQVLTADVFSFTAAGQPWRTQSWLLELGYAWLEATFDGLAWANWLVLVLAVMATCLLALSVFHSTPAPIPTALLLVVGVWLMGPFIQPRPVLASYVLSIALVVILQHRDRMLWAVVPLFWVWAAVHSSWPIGGLLLVTEWLRTRDHRIFRVGIAAAAVTLMTAHGWGAWETVLRFGESSETLALIEEWKVPDFVSIVQGPFLLILFGIIVAAIRGRIAMRDLITIVPFVIIGMNARRTVFPAVIVLLPWAAMAVPAFRIAGARGSALLAKSAATLVAVLVAIPMFVRPLGQLDPERFPSQELVESFAGTTAFGGSGEGGYLIYAAWPETLVYIDDRAELYPYEHFETYQTVLDGDYEAEFDRWGIDAALTQRTWTLTDVLEEDGWVTIAEDEHFVVFGRPGS